MTEYREILRLNALGLSGRSYCRQHFTIGEDMPQENLFDG
jgi:hypothetical protein